ncbi:glycosyltransferase family 2 protein [Leptolyngbya sp. CCNP1308]|uniref:glycosyltransferase family 2 protein n=1 Tax=Leptolyngbya sp. CCNP1308 TaxID=3110255 RepID=UPI002B1F5A42|nr:glycosyltransferase family 2 protein [Leptolyngbya sp. CCNP1308]MEA5448112.1 glycosyltransferase family 2 protein [Leptolyngbya sp. CCNP1308]
MNVGSRSLTLEDLPKTPIDKLGWPWSKASKPLPNYMSDSSEWPRISIVTPSYNQGKFLEETIRSVLLQGYPNLEYIILDGGSTDNSVEIIKKYQPYLAYWASEIDKGQAHAINKGLKISTGSILGWVNSDDLYARGALNKIAQAFRHNKTCTLVHGNRILLNENSQVTGFSPLSSFEPKTNSYNISSETAFWRREAMEQIGLLKESLQFAMDLEFFGRLYLHGHFLKLDDYLGYFRCYSQNKSSTMAHVGLEESIREWKSLFGTQFVVGKNTPSKATLLKSLMLNPITVGLPYLSYKLSKYAS